MFVILNGINPRTAQCYITLTSTDRIITFLYNIHGTSESGWWSPSGIYGDDPTSGGGGGGWMVVGI